MTPCKKTSQQKQQLPLGVRMERIRHRLAANPPGKVKEKLEGELAACKAEQDAMVMSHHRAVCLQAAKFKRINPHLDLDDLRQEGYLGLMEGALLFDPRRCIRWTTYAFRCIWAKMIRYAQENTGQIRVPLNLVMKAWKGTLGQADDKEATGASEENVKKVLAAIYGISSWSSWSKDDDGSPLANLRAKEDSHLDYDERELLDQMMRGLPERERGVVWDRACGQTLDAIAGAMGVTKERVRQLETRALQRMRQIAGRKKRANLCDDSAKAHE